MVPPDSIQQIELKWAEIFLIILAIANMIPLHGKQKKTGRAFKGTLGGAPCFLFYNYGIIAAKRQ